MVENYQWNVYGHWLKMKRRNKNEIVIFTVYSNLTGGPAKPLPSETFCCGSSEFPKKNTEKMVFRDYFYVLD